MAIRRALLAAAVLAALFAFVGSGAMRSTAPAFGQSCSAAYPDFCIPPPPPDLDCGSAVVGGRVNFTALAPDPHRLDEGGIAGLACEDPNRPRFPTTTTTIGPTSTTSVTLIFPTSTTTTVPPAQNLPTGLLDRTG